MKPHRSARPVLIAMLVLIFVMACAAPATLPATIPVPTVATVPPSAQSPTSSTRAPEEVLGSVLIEQGRSAAGGTAGSTIQVEVELWATSTAGKVTEMRVASVGGCDGPGQVEKAP